jgi:hypothetical protein
VSGAAVAAGTVREASADGGADAAEEADADAADPAGVTATDALSFPHAAAAAASSVTAAAVTPVRHLLPAFAARVLGRAPPVRSGEVRWVWK